MVVGVPRFTPSQVILEHGMLIAVGLPVELSAKDVLYFFHCQGGFMKQYWVYILSNEYGKLYIGVTNDLERRVYEHKAKLVPGYTKTHNITRLVYFEDFVDAYEAIAREKQLKGWLRRKKVSLINAFNPGWKDLAEHNFSAEE